MLHSAPKQQRNTARKGGGVNSDKCASKNGGWKNENEKRMEKWRQRMKGEAKKQTIIENVG